MPQPKLIFLGPILALAAGCLSPVFAQDHPDLQRHYLFKNDTSCTSWLRSHKTGHMYCASPPFVIGAGGTAEEAVAAGPALEELSAAEQIVDDKHLLERGEVVYGAICEACHQANGEGMAGSFPPLAGSGEFYGDARNQARIIVDGLSGEIVVQGQKFSGSMPPQGHLTDYDVAAVASYVRNSWGNSDGMVTPADVAAVR